MRLTQFWNDIAHLCEHVNENVSLALRPATLTAIQRGQSVRFGDLMLRRMGWNGQHTGEPKPTDSPDNLYETLPGDPGAHGRFDGQARESTLWTSLRLRRWLVGGTAAVAAGAVAARELARTR